MSKKRRRDWQYVSTHDRFCFVTVSVGCMRGEIKESFLVGVDYSSVRLVKPAIKRSKFGVTGGRSVFSYSVQMDALLLLYRPSVTDNEMNEVCNRVDFVGGERQDKAR
jgi:hypothetical protein